MEYGYYNDKGIPESIAKDKKPIADYKTNSHGYRCPEFSPLPAGKKNVVVLGCSHTFGEGLKDDEHWVHFVSQHNTKMLRWWNLGQPGASADKVVRILYGCEKILFPKTIKFENEDFTYVKDILSYLEQIGFELREFSDNSLIIEGVPSDLPFGRESEVIYDILDHYIKTKSTASSFIEYMAATYACKAAIKAGDKLDQNECKSLIDQLFSTEHPYYCPHGRPIIVNLTIDDLDKRFERH